MVSKTRIENDKRKLILDWAVENGWVIDPSTGMEQYVENILKFGYCPCDPIRPDCPCPESVIEVERDGHCLCRLYWKDYKTFRAILKAGYIKGKEKYDEKGNRKKT